MTSTKTVKTFLLSLIFGTALLLTLLFLSGIQSARAAQSWLPETSGSVAYQGITLAATDTVTGTFGIMYEPMNPKVGEEVTFTITRSGQTMPATMPTIFDVDFGDGYFGGKPVTVEMSLDVTQTQVKHTYQYPSFQKPTGADYHVVAKYTPDSGMTWKKQSVVVKVRPVLTLTYEPAEPKAGDVMTYCATINPGYRKQDLTNNVYRYDEYVMEFGDSDELKATNTISNFPEREGKLDTTCFTHTYAASGTYTANVIYKQGVYGSEVAYDTKTVFVPSKGPIIPPGLVALPGTGDEMVWEENGDKLTGVTSLRSQGVGYVTIDQVTLANIPTGSFVTSATFFSAFTITFYDAQGVEMNGVNLAGVNYVMTIAGDTKPQLWRSSLRAMYQLGSIWHTLWHYLFAKATTTSLAEAAAGTLTFPLQTDANIYVIRGSSNLSLYLPVITR